MINLEELLIKLVNELSYSEFQAACRSAGINDELQSTILDLISMRGE